MTIDSKQYRIDDRDWSALSMGERIRHIEEEGYLIIPDFVPPDYLAELKAEADMLETVGRDYSERQRGCPNMHLKNSKLAELIAFKPTIDFLEELLGDDLIFVHSGYDRSEPGTPGISLHTDGQPYGSRIFGYEGSCPITIRVLYYLDDLTLDVSPFRVIPRSHLCIHADANPYKRYESHPEQVVVPCKARSVLFLNHKVFHGTLPNVGDRTRSMLSVAYRPAWAGPIADVDPRDQQELVRLPKSVLPYFGDPNTREYDFGVSNKPNGMGYQAAGMNPSRWNRNSSKSWPG
ncbi:MAG: phytanoyl-CoA dioxygenase family protein [Gemmatimonadota bacterium]|nr:phytanoyl-CoA dioxygenase family protein [Gemmatimonadota bacterium]